MIASGSLNRPKRPASAAALPAGLHQIDASDYRSAAALPDGAVLVVGCAQSGGQIAEDLAEAGRPGASSPPAASGGCRGATAAGDMSIWLVESGLFDMPRKDADRPGRRSGRCIRSACSR